MGINIPNFIAVALMVLGTGFIGSLVAHRIRLFPPAAWFVIAGALLAVCVEYWGLDTAIRSGNFKDLVFYVFLPVLVYESAYVIPHDQLRKYLPTILLMASVGLLISIAVASILLWHGVGYASYTIWAAILTAIMLSATDPIAVIAQLKSLGASKQVQVLLEGESLFNDATVIVLFTFVLHVLQGGFGGDGSSSYLWALADLLRVFFGGMLVGVLLAYIIEYARLKIGHSAPVLVSGLLTAYGSFYIAEHFLHVSGIMAVLMAAIVAHSIHRNNTDNHTKAEIHSFWDGLAQVCTMAVFVILGLVITVEMFTQRWVAMLLAIVCLLIARTVSVYVGFGLARAIPSQHNINKRYRPLLVWGGLRGVIAIALALAVSAENIDHWYTIQAMVFGVVLFSMFVQAPTMPILGRRLKAR